MQFFMLQIALPFFKGDKIKSQKSEKFHEMFHGFRDRHLPQAPAFHPWDQIHSTYILGTSWCSRQRSPFFMIFFASRDSNQKDNCPPLVNEAGGACERLLTEEEKRKIPQLVDQHHSHTLLHNNHLNLGKINRRKDKQTTHAHNTMQRQRGKNQQASTF